MNVAIIVEIPDVEMKPDIMPAQHNRNIYDRWTKQKQIRIAPTELQTQIAINVAKTFTTTIPQRSFKITTSRQKLQT